MGDNKISMNNDEWNLEKATLKDMIQKGYVEIFGVFPDGREMRRLTEKFAEDFPDKFRFIDINDGDILSSLWFKGYIDIALDEDSEIYIGFTDKSNDWKETQELDKHEKDMMRDIILYSHLIEGE